MKIHPEPTICNRCPSYCIDNQCQGCKTFYFPRLGTSILDKWAAQHAPELFYNIARKYV